MQIKRISIKNYLGIKELDYDLGKINIIKADSGRGKTSFIEGIENLFTNTKRRTEVVRHGEKEAILFCELDDGMSVERKVRTETVDYLKVKHDSKAVSSTENYLRKFINGDIFRPIEFVNKPTEEQAKIILRMLEIPWTVENIKSWFGEVPEADYQKHILQILKEIEAKYYKERESVNREISIFKANIEGIKKDLPANYDGAQWKDLKLDELYKLVTDAEENNKKLDIAENFINRLKEQLQSIEQIAENDKESKRLLYSRQRDSLKNVNQDLVVQTETEQALVNDADRRINEESIRLDNELEQAIKILKMQYVTKKQLAKDNVMREVDQAKVDIQEYQATKANNETKLIHIDELEKKDIELIEQDKKSKIETENTKTYNAQKIIMTVEKVDIEPLRTKANEAAKMKEFLREWERMNDIIREKISPKEKRASELTTKIEKARDLPQELLKTAALPVEGLEVDAQGRIRVNGTLLDGLSDGEKIEFAFRLAKAQAGELKVICIDGIQNLGSKAEKILAEAATDDFQYFLLWTQEGEPFSIETLEV